MAEVTPLTRILKSINGKTELIDQEWIDANYQPFVINMVMGRTIDGIFLAEYLNRNHELSRWLQYLTYYDGMARNSQRFGKKVDEADGTDKYLQAVMSLFDYSRTKALEAMQVLSEQDLNDIAEAIRPSEDNYESANRGRNRTKRP